MLTHFTFVETVFAEYLLDPYVPFFTGLKKVNVLIGQNNSGKSRFMRRLASSPITIVHDRLTDRRNKFIETFLQKASHKRNDAFSSTVQIKLQRLRQRNFTDNELITVINELAIELRGEINKTNDHDQKSDLENLYSDVFSTNTHLYTHPDFNNIEAHTEYVRTYIPTIRGLRRLKTTEEVLAQGSKIATITDDAYKNLARIDYFSSDRDTRKCPEIVTGYSLYDDLIKLLLGDHAKRRLVKDFELFLSESFFPGLDVTLIPNSELNTVTVRIGNGDDRPIHDLGDGIQQIILQTYAVFVSPSTKRLLFVEEPDLFLHPGLQRKLLTIFARHESFANTQVFLTTHSNHLAEVAYEGEDVAVFHFNTAHSIADIDSKPKLVIRKVDFLQRALLEDLGVRHSSLWIVNATIWVEGISDRILIRRYLELYQEYLAKSRKRKYIEDVHFAFMEYSGSNLSHYLIQSDAQAHDRIEKNHSQTSNIILERVCADAMFIADKDSNRDKKHKRYRERFSSNYFVLDCREIENTLSGEILSKVFVALSDKKSKLRQNCIDDTKLKDKKIFDCISEECKASVCKSFWDKNNNIRDKRGFAATACNYLTNWAQLSPAAQEVAQEVYEHVHKKNSE